MNTTPLRKRHTLYCAWDGCNEEATRRYTTVHADDDKACITVHLCVKHARDMYSAQGNQRDCMKHRRRIIPTIDKA